MKPHKGEIYGWRKSCTHRHPGSPQVVYGFLKEADGRDGDYIRTSEVVKHDVASGEIETRNSRYTLVGASV